MSDAPHPRRAPWSIRRRLVVGVVALLAVVGILIGTISVVALRQNLLDRLDGQLDDAWRALPAISGQLPTTPDSVPLSGLVVAATAPDQIASGVVITATGERTPLTTAQLTEVFAAPVGVSTVSIGGLGSYRIELRQAQPTPSLPQGGTIALGLPMSEVDATTWNLVAIFALVTGGALALAAIAAGAVVRVALRPLGRVTDTATRVTELQLASGDVAIPERVPAAEADPRTEVGQVGAAINKMLGHVESALVARQQSEEKVRRFVADASHELRTPLASIRGYAELTRRIDDDLPVDAIRSLDRIESESIRMTALVEDLLELARLDEGQGLVFADVELVRLVTDAVGDAYAAAPDHEWVLEAPEPPLTVEGDQARLHQVVANLLANAHRHTPEGTEVTVTIVEERSDAGDDVVLTVADTGPGIDPELQPRLFERFARGDSSRTRATDDAGRSRATGSTGLGLAIVAAVVEAHQGGIRVESEPGDTRFIVRLPRRRSAAGGSDGLAD